MMAEKKTGKAVSAKAVLKDGKLFSIVSKLSGKAIEAGSGDAVYIAKASRRKSQQWCVEAADEGYRKIVNASTGKCLDIVWEGTDNGAQIHQWDYLGGANQQWTLEPGTDGAYKLKGKASGKCVDVVDMSQEEGAKLQIWEDCDGDNQQWILKEVKAPVKAATADGKAKKSAPKAKAEKKESAAKKK